MVQDIDDILQEINRGVAEMIDAERVENLVKNYYEKGENFYVKQALTQQLQTFT